MNWRSVGGWLVRATPGRLVLASGGMLVVGWLVLYAVPRLLPRPLLLDGVAFSRLVTDRNGDVLRMSLAADEMYRLRTTLGEIHPDLVRATLLYEDRYFFLHPGINPLALGRALLYTLLTGPRRMGGSTLTMQVARLRYGLRTGSWPDKIRQLWLALRLEAHYTKNDILEAYFNLAPYGNNIEGAGAAARIFFHKAALNLTLAESLALAVTPQHPARRGLLAQQSLPHADQALTAARQRLAALWQASATAHTSNPASLLHAPLQVYGPAALPFAAPHATTALLAASTAPRVHTTLDTRLQTLLEGHIRRFAERGRRYGLHNAAALLVHWPSMEVRALVGSANFHNPAIQGQVDATRARRSPGSTLKPFIYALALDQGLIHPMTLLLDTPRTFHGYDPENFDQTFRGPVPAHEALTSSRNIPAIALAAQLRYPDLYDFLRRAEVRMPFAASHYGLALVLGGAEVSMLEMAGLYAMLPNHGIWRAPRLLQEQPGQPARLLSPEAAFVTLHMLRNATDTIATPHGLVPLYLKTGTSNGFRDAWAAGVVGPYVLVIWAGNFDNTPNPLLVGRQVAVPLFTDVAQALDAVAPLRDLCAEPAPGLNLIRTEVCTATGDVNTSMCPETTPTWFIPGVSPIADTGIFQSILIDQEHGLRACVEEPGRTTRQVWEFWPSDLQKQFARAGMPKPAPPAWMPGCAAGTGATGSRHAAGRMDDTSHTGPRIIIPREGMVYQRRLSDPTHGALALTASLGADATRVFWFVGTHCLGERAGDEPLMWVPPPGVSELRAVDDNGNSSRIRLVVESLP